MKSAVLGETLIVAIGDEEALTILRGEEVGGKINPHSNDASSIVFKQFAEIEPDYVTPEVVAERRRLQIPIPKSVVKWGKDSGCAVYVPTEVLEDAFMGLERVELDEIQFETNEFGEAMQDVLPVSGMTIRFDNGIGDSEFFDLAKTL